MKMQWAMGGLDDVMARLTGLKASVANGILRPAMVKATRVVVKAVKQKIKPSGRVYLQKKVGKDMSVAIKKQTGILKKSIGAVIKTTRGKVVARVGARRGFKVLVGKRSKGKNKGKNVFHSASRIVHLVELGHGGRNPAPPHPFMRPGWEASKDAARAIIRQEVSAGIRRAVAKGKMTTGQGILRGR